MSLTAQMEQFCSQLRAARSMRQGMVRQLRQWHREMTAWQRERQRAQAAWRDGMSRFRGTLRDRSGAIRDAAGSLIARFAAERRERNMPGQVERWRSQRLVAGADLRRGLGQWHMWLAGTVHRSLHEFRSARQQASALSARERSQGRMSRRQGINRALAGMGQDRAGARAALAALRQVQIPAGATPGAGVAAAASPPEMPVTTPPASGTNRLDMVYMLVNSHPEGLSVVDAEKLLGLPRVVVGQAMRRLVEAGQVRRDRGLYFADSGPNVQ